MRIQNNQRGSHHVLLVVVAVLAIGGLLGWTFYQSVASKSSESNVTDKKEVADLQVSELGTLADIAEIQSDAVLGKGNVTIDELQLTESDGLLVYKLHLSDGTELTYDANSGEKLKTEAETESDEAEDTLPANVSGGIGFAKALEIAMAEKPGSTVSKIQLELEDGIVVYSVRFNNKARVDVNADTGAIVRTKAAKVGSSQVKRDDNSRSGSSDNEDDDNTSQPAAKKQSSDDSDSDDDSSSGRDDSDDEADEAEDETEDKDDDNSGSGRGR